MAHRYRNADGLPPNLMEIKMTRISWIIVGAIAFLLLLMSYFTVPAGHVAVVRTLGTVGATVYYPTGRPYFLVPFFQSYQLVDVRLDPVEAKASAASYDQQIVNTEIAMQYSLNATLVPIMLNEIGDRKKIADALIPNGIQESVKAATAQYTAEDLIRKRGEVKAKMVETLQQQVDGTLAQKGLKGLIQIANVSITDFDFSAEFNKSIEAKVRTAQEALQAVNEQQKRKTQAETELIEKKLAADGVAYKVTKEGEARAAAIRIEGEAIKANPLLIELRTREKWDGVLPRFSGGGAIPFINIDGQPGATTVAR